MRRAAGRIGGGRAAGWSAGGGPAAPLFTIDCKHRSQVADSITIPGRPSPAGAAEAMPSNPPPQRASPPIAAKARALLDACFEQYRGKLIDIGRASIEMSGDLFEGNDYVEDKDVDDFKAKRGAWVSAFDKALRELYERRLGGARRKGRRPDFDASASTLRVLTAFDQEKQAALVAATAFLYRLTRRELEALELRVGSLLPAGELREPDNPFGPPYILDAIGMSARATYPNPRIWRPFMERVVADLTPAANKVYITLNRHLADQGVLPEIKAELRARSEFRPVDDKDLIPTFSQMLHEAGQALPADVAVPQLGDAASATVFDFAAAGGQATEAIASIVPSAAAAGTQGATRDAAPAQSLAAGLAAIGAEAPRRSADATGGDALFPDLDPLMALGTSTPLFNTLGHWQRIDLPAELAKLVSAGGGASPAAAIPLNLIPHIRAAVVDQVANPTDRITMDVIGLLFDYIFRDPSIPDSMRRLFGRLQVPVLKAALLDRTFFSDAAHPVRKLLDRLAEAAIGSTHDASYCASFERASAAVVLRICRDYEIDASVFAAADAELAAFLDAERSAVERGVREDVAVALEAERSEADRAHVRALVRDRLAGLALPFEVRGFVETTWADYLTALRRDQGAESAEWIAATRTLDDLLWSILAKERTAQKARLTKLIPTLVVALRKGCAAVNAPVERTRAFFDALYPLHVAAIRPRPEPEPREPAAPAAPAEDAEATGIERGRPRLDAANVHDFVSEMAVGTWLSFRREDGPSISARLTWVSPMRTKYIFTSRSRAHAFLYSPEELAWELVSGKASLVLEPVPLFDRAVSAALDTLAAHRPAGAPAPTPAGKAA
jgi:hypothetical protein